MDHTAASTTDDLSLPVIRQHAVPTVADQVFDVLQQRILTLELPPQTKISEADVSRKMGVSRQPVREAFKRLAKLGFLQIRPQSGTTVSLISEEAVLRASFIRSALEVRTCRTACETRKPADLKKLQSTLDKQRAAIDAGDRALFHALDDQFHTEICIIAGVEYVWGLIQESKAHMDRIRMLSLTTSSQRLAFEEHIVIFDAIAAGEPEAAETAITRHLSRIVVLIEAVKSQRHSFFQDTGA